MPSNNPSLISLVSRDGVNITLPVTPQEITIRTGNQIVRHNLLTVGEVAQIGAEKCDMISFSSFFPEYTGSYVNGANHLQVGDEGLEPIDFRSPQEWVNLINEMKSKPILVIISYPTIMNSFMIENFNPKLIGGHGRDIHYDLSLVEFRDVKIESYNPLGHVGPAGGAETIFELLLTDSRSHIVRQGESIVELSRRYGRSVPLLKNLNGIRDSSVDLPPYTVLDIGDARSPFRTEFPELLGE